MVASRFIGVRINPIEHEQLIALASAEETTASDILREALRLYAYRTRTRL
ncbi:MAG: hypothetical protein NUW22_12660 [Acidobacteria bacterium]|nr:hypothetical protein [Acidobacteriota bacterium]